MDSLVIRLNVTVGLKLTTAIPQHNDKAVKVQMVMQNDRPLLLKRRQ